MIQCGATNGSNTAFMAELKLNSVEFQHPRRKRNANFESGARKNRGNRQPLLLFKQWQEPNDFYSIYNERMNTVKES